MKILALAFSLLALTAAHAQPKEDPKLTALFDKADWPKEKLIDCKGASKDAVTQVPVEIAGFARIVCTKSGHHFTSKRGWHWHHQADGLPPFFVSAGSSLAVNGVVPETIGHKGYFTKIEVKRIDYWRNFSASYPFVLATRVPVLQAINEQITQKKACPTNRPHHHERRGDDCASA